MAKTQSKDDQFLEAIKPPEVKTTEDLLEILEMLKDSHKDESVGFDVKFEGRTFKGKSDSASLYDMLVQGFDVVKKRLEAYNKGVEELKGAIDAGQADERQLDMFKIDTTKYDVDNLIRMKLGGKRSGMRVRWVLQEGVFELDPYTRKVYQITDE